MKILHLTIKKKWFDMILLQLTKPEEAKYEEYREVKKYWVNRLADYYIGNIGGDFMDKHNVISYKFKKIDAIKFVNGYASNAPSFIIECKGIDIGEAKPEWSDNWQGDVFRIKLGNIIETINSPF